ncbi:AAK AK-HSDH: amino acid kinase superfamily aak domain-containing protein [Plakobranchus ocellatus]|uniref:AAK AK-HSDH: amino acid kinase superfamily aak domain-containing protein n=1 Tax=Plakobranchus ocellatus TaxID=259542 RepID=A0AAV4BGI2_9GAST|nr:AAK AK-HSDH: amino acid kinase superfamily aak domain-containing protein [Plakobranchus ocellatus]
MLQKSPLRYTLANDITCFNPDTIKRQPEMAQRMLCKLARHLYLKKWITAEEVDQCEFDYQTFSEYISSVPYNDERLDEHFKEYGQLERMPSLQKVINIVLLLSHSNADVERGFSVNKEASVENLLEESLVARRLICQYVSDSGLCMSQVPITKEMLQSSSQAWHRYSNALAEKKRRSRIQAEKGKVMSWWL